MSTSTEAQPDTCPARPGATCTNCGAPLIVVNTKIIKATHKRRRYYGCRSCGHRPENNVVEIPLDYAPPRNKVLPVAHTSDSVH